MNEQYRTKWYNSPRVMLGLFLLGAWQPFMLIPAFIVFLLHYKHHHAMLMFAKDAEEREQALLAKEFASEDMLRQAKVEASNLVSRANQKKVALEIEIIELKKEIALLTSQVIEADDKTQK